MRELLASEEVDYALPAESAPEAVVEALPEPPPRSPSVDRLSETVDYDPSALRPLTLHSDAPAFQPPAHPRSAAELAEEGFVCFRLKDYAGAIENWEASRSLDPSNKTLNYNLKLAHARLAGNARAEKA